MAVGMFIRVGGPSVVIDKIGEYPPKPKLFAAFNLKLTLILGSKVA